MHRSTPWRVVTLATVLAVAACGSDTATTSDPAPADAGGSPSHPHADDGGVDVSDWPIVPTVDATASPDPMSGVNLFVQTTGFTFAPERASLEPVDGEGHAHVFVDGEKVGRLYGNSMHLDLPAGEHEIRVDLHANDHAPLLLDDIAVADVVTVEVPGGSGDDAAHEHGAHDHGAGFAATEPVPTVSLSVSADPMRGYNVRVVTTDFTLTPEKASTAETVAGEGHAHLYVDGRKVARLYGEWFHFDGDLKVGDHEFRVELNANDHAPYVADGAPIEDAATVTVEGADPVAAADVTMIELSVRDGVVEGGGRHTVPLGGTVTLRVTTDTADEVHVHGYDVTVDAPAGETVDVTFVADIPGVFEVELEAAHLPLVELEIS